MALFVFATEADAQRRKTTRKKRARTTAVAKKPKEVVVAVPTDSLIGRVYGGKVGRTVTDFFGSRVTYGDVRHQVYVWRDSIAVLHHWGGDTDVYEVLPYKHNGTALTLGGFTYSTIRNGKALSLNKTTENKETREGILTLEEPEMMARAIYMRGKYLDGMSIQTDEDKRNALIMLRISAEEGDAEAQQYLAQYFKKRADKGEPDAIREMLDRETAATNYAEAHKYIDMLIAMEPENMELLCEKGTLYVSEGNESAAKRVYKKIRKGDREFFEASQNPFLVSMRAAE